MSAAIVALLLVPAPYDLVRAESLLRQPPGTPTEPWPEGRRAILLVMLREGATDPGGESLWFPPTIPWDRDLDDARAVVQAVRGCPSRADGWWLPDPPTCSAVAAANRAHAELLRTRIAWEPDREAALDRAATEAEGLAQLWDFLAISGGGGWQRPRRLALGEVRVALGPLWERREWPPTAVWWAARER